jgi:hypothetical protein
MFDAPLFGHCRDFSSVNNPPDNCQPYD